ncbi:MAG: hypothetical protein KF773_35185 [Deltaproteobacteria bacterium]|nr:hypothetical protein [Deltaproteobacteria bacterium]MCW5805301.1 hypothetical protein [Deltaproteobacteria bacterium]
MKRLLITAALVLGAAARPAAAQSSSPLDYDPGSQLWNGLASFVGLAEALGFEVSPVVTLEWGELSDNEILMLVYPTQHVDPGKLAAFLHAGGNAIIADDFGDGKDAMQYLGLLRAETTVPRAKRYYKGILHAPIATPASDHPLAEGVDEVVTNHPAALTHVEGATSVIEFDDGGAVVVAGERGSGRFIAVGDPSIFINRMQQFPGNLTLARNMLRWLNRGGRARRVVIVRGDVPMYGDPRALIYDPRADKLGRSIAELNHWLAERRAWLLTPGAMKALAAILGAILLVLALVALPVRRGPKIDGAWLRFGRPIRRDDPHLLVHNAERNAGSNLVLACILRDQVQVLLAGITSKLEPLYTVAESQLVADVSRARGPEAGAALARVYRRLRALPSRGQVAAPWSAGHLPRRDFDTLYRDVGELCRTLGSELPFVPSVTAGPGQPT